MNHCYGAGGPVALCRDYATLLKSGPFLSLGEFFLHGFIKGKGGFCVKNKKFKEGNGPNFGPYSHGRRDVTVHVQ